MESLYRHIDLPNGMKLLVHDHSRRYFGDYFHVRLEVRCAVSVTALAGELPVDLDMAQKLLGDEVIYSKMLERMGVPSGEVASVQAALLADYCSHSLQYLGSSEFPARLVLAELKRRQRQGRGRW